METNGRTHKRIADEYDPLTNWRLSKNFDPVSEAGDKRSGNHEAVSDRRDQGSAVPGRKQKRSRFAKAVMHDDYENEDDDEFAEDAAASSTSVVSESSLKSTENAVDHRKVNAASDANSASKDERSSGAKRKIPTPSDDSTIEVLSTTNTNRRHAFGSRMNPLVVASPKNDDDHEIKCVKRQMHIEDYYGAKFTGLHNMLATNTTSPSSSKSSSRSSVQHVISPARSSASIPLAKSALLGNIRESGGSASNFMRQKPYVQSPASTKPTHFAAKSSVLSSSNSSTASNNSMRRVAHQPAGKASERTPIMLPSSCRIAYTIRQHQLSLLVDSCLLEFRNDDDITTADIFAKCREEEKAIAESVTSPLAYKNRLRMLLLQIKKNHAFGAAPAPVSAAVSSTSNNNAASTTTDPAFADVAVVYKLMQPYILTTEQLLELGFPYFADEEARQRGVAQSSTAKTNEAIDGNGLKLKRICCRCNLPFELTDKGKYVTKSQCIYHPKHAFSRRQPGQGFVQRYLCCDDSTESAGCATCKHHVSNEYPTMHGFVETLQPSINDDVEGVQKGVFSLDCEMVYTAGGVEVAKVTVVNHLLEVVYDSFIIPEHQIIDLNARFSGLKREDFNDATKDLPEVQRDLLKVFGTESILIGHSLQSDLLALKVVHGKCVDTSMVWPHRRGPPFKRALRNLMREILQMIIQEDISGHDSKEDACACMRLMLYKIKQDLTKRKS